MPNFVAAQPGWGIIQGVHDDAERPEDIFIMPIVAWDIIGSEDAPWADPITFEAVTTPYYIVAPDGRIFSSHDDSFDNITALHKYFKEKLK